MSESAIKVEGLSKRYRIGRRERYLALRDVMANALRAPLRIFSKNGAGQSSAPEYIWSLKDVSFEVQPGEAVGIIGRNGAGKTTLLKILSRVTRPTEGRAEVCGRIGSLLEVGTGFHPELTGRENVFLNGAILGMSRVEIRSKFDEIVEFSGVEQFIDTPLKHYSSGMQMRLAFSVAAHLEPEILLVDEVLAVGDAEFQKKCMGKMEEVAHRGRTVLFVSHNMGAIRRLCTRTIWIDAGRIREQGPTTAVVGAYEASAAEKRVDSQPGAAAGVRILSWGIAESNGDAPHTLRVLGPVTIEFQVAFPRLQRLVHMAIALRTVDNELVWAWCADDLEFTAGTHSLHFRFPILPVRPGIYRWYVGLWSPEECLDEWYGVPDMTVATENHQHRLDNWTGLLNVPCEFQLR